MKSIVLSVFISIALSIGLRTTMAAAPSAVREAPNANVANASKPVTENPSGLIKGTVKAMLGHSYGYVPPVVGQQFELDLSSLALMRVSLDFGDKQKGEWSYIPVPGPFLFKDVDWGHLDGKPYWGYFKAVSNNDEDKHGGYQHQVTIEVDTWGQRNPDQHVTVWITIENNNRTTGVCMIDGLVTSQKTKDK